MLYYVNPSFLLVATVLKLSRFMFCGDGCRIDNAEDDDDVNLMILDLAHRARHVGRISPFPLIHNATSNPPPPQISGSQLHIYAFKFTFIVTHEIYYRLSILYYGIFYGVAPVGATGDDTSHSKIIRWCLRSALLPKSLQTMARRRNFEVIPACGFRLQKYNPF